MIGTIGIRRILRTDALCLYSWSSWFVVLLLFCRCGFRKRWMGLVPFPLTECIHTIDIDVLISSGAILWFRMPCPITSIFCLDLNAGRASQVWNAPFSSHEIKKNFVSNRLMLHFVHGHPRPLHLYRQLQKEPIFLRNNEMSDGMSLSHHQVAS